MRPQRLEFTAIGSYPGNIAIDFDALAPFGLFHIHGPTGAGKSSILDALCFALYGSVPPPRLTDRLRSDHASSAVEAVATLEFASQGVDYRIVRKPAQLRPKKRGTGTTKTWPEAALFRKAGNEWIPISDDVREVDAKMLDLIGLDARQFMQVVVLPQGAFAEVLRANAEEREKLLRTLFHTERFETYTERLKLRADASRASYEAHESDLLRKAERINELGAALDLIEANAPKVSVDPDGVAYAQSLSAKADTVQRVASAQRSALEAEHHAAATHLQTVLIAAEHWTRKVGAQTRLQSLDAEREIMLEVQAEIEAADAVAPLVPLVESAQQLAEMLESAESKQRAALTELRGASERLEWDPDLQATMQSIDGDATPAAFAQAKHLGRERASKMELLAAAASSISHEQNELESLLAKTNRLAEDAAELCERAEEQELAVQAQDLELQALRESARDWESLEAAQRIAQSEHAAAKRLPAARASVLDAQKSYLAAEQEGIDAQQAQIDLMHRRLQAIAGELASRLVDGGPCDVCGSLEHPALASQEGVVTQQELDNAEAVVIRAQHTIAELRKKSEAAESELQALLRTAGSAADLPDAGASALEAAKLACTTCSDARTKLEAAEARSKALAGELVSVREAEQAAHRALAEANALANATKLRLDGLVQQHGEINVGEIAEHNAALLQSLDALDAVQSASERLVEVQAQSTQSSDRLLEALASSSASSATEVHNLARSPQQLQLLRSKVEQWRSACATAQHTLEDPAVQAIEDAPDVAGAQDRVRALKAELDEMHARTARLDAQVEDLKNTVDDLVQKATALRPLQEERDRLVTLAQLCDGKQSNAMRMSLERYVLAAYLEEVADAASLRLNLMSSGRYRLRHSDAVAKRKAASGLGLVVSDAYTGAEREVSTLSGGETFLASLALALGLADVVQQHAGGVAIEALFVDEGFGSLDPETLDLAMAELDRLREGGRLVGVISHVGALRERIPVGIEVIKGSHGSTLRISGLDELVTA